MSDHTKHSVGASKAPLRKICCTILLVLFLGAFYASGFYIHGLLSTAKESIQTTYKKTKVKKVRNVSSVLKQKKPISILLLGTDTGDLGRSDTGRTDTMIVATINTTTNRTTLTSIPRDTTMKIPGSSDTYDKINSAYTIGGTSMAIKAVQKLLDIPIDYYVLINMSGLRQIVDAVGGITITPTLTFQYEDANVVKGQKVTLNGKQALSYARMRHDDPLNDYGRQKRQRQVIQAIAKKAMNFSSLSKYDSILNTLKSNMQTDLSYDDIWALETNYKDSAKSISSDYLHCKNGWYDEASLQIATSDERQRISNKIRAELELNDSTSTFEDDTGIADIAISTAQSIGQ